MCPEVQFIPKVVIHAGEKSITETETVSLALYVDHTNKPSELLIKHECKLTRSLTRGMFMLCSITLIHIILSLTIC